MFSVSFYTLISVVIVSLVSLLGAFVLAVRAERLAGLLAFVVALSAGTLLGDAFLHLLPESAGADNALLVWLSVLGGMLIFFILEKIICWRHCHLPTTEEHPHPVGLMNLLGDALHNFLDGAIIAGSFLVSVPLGLTTTLAVIIHEIPQEMCDVGIMLHAGYSRRKAVMFNLLSSGAAIVGALFALAVGASFVGFVNFIVPFTAGGFIYIATADLIPELHKETSPRRSLRQLVGIILGILAMLFLKMFYA